MLEDNQESTIKRACHVYGIEQAQEHIKELRQSVYEGKKHYLNAEFEIVETTTVTTVYKVEEHK